MKQLLLYWVTAILAGSLACQQNSLHHEKYTFFQMGTAIEVTVVTKLTSPAIEPLWQSIDSLLAFWGEHYSQSHPQSEVHALNNRTSSNVAVSPRLGSMLADALRWGDSTKGMFDITILPVKELWGLGETDTVQSIPGQDTLSRVIAKVNYTRVRLNDVGDTVTFVDPDTRLDAGGVAKVYALTATCKFLDKSGFTDYLIAAGDIMGKGRRVDGRPWVIGIQHPRITDSLIATIELDSGVIFTSGDYEHYWMSGDRRIHHIFNSKTGYSCTNNQSVTIYSQDPIRAKYLSTGLFCLPADSILRYVTLRNLDCMVVDSAGRVYISTGWSNKVNLMVGGL